MDRKLTKAAILVIGFCLVLSLVVNVPRCAAQNSWSDDFSDGNYSDWTIEEGTFDASNFILETAGDAGGTSDWHCIRHSSEVAYGNWSLDMYINGTERIGYWITFIGDELFEYGVPGIWMPRNGYALWFFSASPAEVGLEVWTDDDFDPLGTTWYPTALNGWQNITITRDLVGAFTFSVNGTTRITATDNTHAVSHIFGWSCDPWSAVDNVVINELPPPPPFPIELILIGAGAAIVIIFVVIIVVIFLRRRS